MTVEQLRAVEDTCIRAVVAMQVRVGIQSVTDGEFRRNSWRDNFFERTDGYSRHKVQSSFFFTEFDGSVHRGGSAPVAIDRLKRHDPITADDFAALAPHRSRCSANPKTRTSSVSAARTRMSSFDSTVSCSTRGPRPPGGSGGGSAHVSRQRRPRPGQWRL
jgi:hypothetical protein